MSNSYTLFFWAELDRIKSSQNPANRVKTLLKIIHEIFTQSCFPFLIFHTLSIIHRFPKIISIKAVYPISISPSKCHRYCCYPLPAHFASWSLSATPKKAESSEKKKKRTLTFYWTQHDASSPSKSQVIKHENIPHAHFSPNMAN